MNWDEAIYIRKKIEKKLDEDNGYGIPPKPMTACSATAGDGYVELSWSLPGNTVVDNQVLAEVEGVVIIRKIGSAPQSISDGVKVTESKLSIGTFVDNGVENGQIYYYRFIPYSTEGAYSMDPANVKTANPEYIIYGFHDDFTDLNPDTRITYPNEVVNSGYTPMHTNKDTGTPTAGSWATFLTDFLKNKPAMIKLNGELDYWLDPSDYTKKLDGTASDIYDTAYSGAGAFAWLDKVYMKEVYDQDDNGRTVYFCKSKPDNDYYPVGFVDENDNELDGIWLPMFYMNNTNYKSIAMVTPIQSTNRTLSALQSIMSNFSTRAKFYGGPILNVIRDLEIMLFKTSDLNTKIGFGQDCMPRIKPDGTDDGTYDFMGGNNSVYINGISPNGVVSGWYGSCATSGAQTINDKTNGYFENSINKRFHSMALGNHSQRRGHINPYLWVSRSSFKFSYNYGSDLEEFDTAPSGYDNLGGYALSGYPYRTKHLSKKYGSIKYLDPDNLKIASRTTGYANGSMSVYYDTYYKDGIYLPMYGTMHHNECDGESGSPYYIRASEYPGNMTYYANILMLPPANYNPNT